MFKNIKNWFHYEPFNIKYSAGIVIVLKKEKVLLCHPTGHKWFSSYSFPKGQLDKNETHLQAALRECQEETSIIIDIKQISNLNTPIIVEYKNKKGQKYKIVYLYTVYINDISEIKISSEILPTENLQIDEVDWAGFLTFDEAKKRIFHRFYQVLDMI